jgi:hypothetical protein
MGRRVLDGMSASTGLVRNDGFSTGLAEVPLAAVSCLPVHSSDLWRGDNLFHRDIQITRRVVAIHLSLFPGFGPQHAPLCCVSYHVRKPRQIIHHHKYPEDLFSAESKVFQRNPTIYTY